MKFKVGDRIIPMTSKFIEGGVIINVMDNDEPFITNIGSTARGGYHVHWDDYDNVKSYGKHRTVFIESNYKICLKEVRNKVFKELFDEV